MALSAYNEKHVHGIDHTNEEGYEITDPEGHSTWCPKAVFEKQNLKLLGSENTITQDDVDQFMCDITRSTIGKKTTLLTVQTVNGFEFSETSSCVDPANYDEKYGAINCLNKVQDHIWEHLGFLLQTANNGFDRRTNGQSE